MKKHSTFVLLDSVLPPEPPGELLVLFCSTQRNSRTKTNGCSFWILLSFACVSSDLVCLFACFALLCIVLFLGGLFCFLSLVSLPPGAFCNCCHTCPRKAMGRHPKFVPLDSTLPPEPPDLLLVLLCSIHNVTLTQKETDIVSGRCRCLFVCLLVC